MIDLIFGARGSGKTTKLIEIANRDGGYIIARSGAEAARLQRCGANHIITASEFMRMDYRGKRIRSFHIDGLEPLLGLLSDVPIRTITMDEPPRMSIMGAWRDAR